MISNLSAAYFMRLFYKLQLLADVMLVCIYKLINKNITDSVGFEKKTLYLHDFDKRNRINHNKI